MSVYPIRRGVTPHDNPTGRKMDINYSDPRGNLAVIQQLCDSRHFVNRA
ncbi:hypothetical protein LPIBR_60144 [Lacticaseibacillus paracasei]|nr:hypothetical protein LPIBR_60144 [Lacticaseibacillus paracasei]